MTPKIDSKCKSKSAESSKKGGKKKLARNANPAVELQSEVSQTTFPGKQRKKCKYSASFTDNKKFL